MATRHKSSRAIAPGAFERLLPRLMQSHCLLRFMNRSQASESFSEMHLNGRVWRLTSRVFNTSRQIATRIAPDIVIALITTVASRPRPTLRQRGGCFYNVFDEQTNYRLLALWFAPMACSWGSLLPTDTCNPRGVTGALPVS
ncbi:hypothetical protein EVAR_49540_1 [Eumeta japonica]|uniref:Uncharacterized protein n=1 Tax=Eumeta variegata TaxID=151549 RepID=A0A4C1XMI4_EUMVA|nr:hypothetical protein EVAR_49540_1 [Eumeta japonica]